MSKLKALRDLVVRWQPSLVQYVGAGGVSWGVWERWPWLGKAVGGALLVAFGVASERARGES